MSKKENVSGREVMPVADKLPTTGTCSRSVTIMLAMPLLIIGAMSLLIEEFPVTGYADFMAGIFGKHWGTFFWFPIMHPWRL